MIAENGELYLKFQVLSAYYCLPVVSASDSGALHCTKGRIEEERIWVTGNGME